jgi:hypothetical protein
MELFMAYQVYIVNIVFAGVLLVVGKKYHANFYSQCDKISKALEQTAEELKKIRRDEYELRYYDIDNIISDNKFLKESWNEYKKTLTAYQNSDIVHLYSTQATSDYINFYAIVRNLNIEFWQNLGGIFTGIGIFGTFAGLVIGLHGIDVTTANVDAMKAGIGNLLSGISTAFLTSVMGILCALGFNFFHNKCVIKVKDNLIAIVEILEDMYPRRTQEIWLADTLIQNKQQTEALQNLSSELAIALGDQLEQKLSPSFDRLVKDLAKIMQENLAPTLQGVKESLDNLNNGGVKAIGEGINDGVGNELKGFANTLIDLQNSMQKSFAATQQTGASANEKLSNMVDELTEKIAQGSSDALKAQNEQIEKMAEKMQEVTDNMSKAAVAGGGELSRVIAEVTSVMKGSIDSAAEKQNATLTATCEQIRSVLADVNENLVKTTNDTTKAQQTQVEAAVLQMNSIMNKMNEAAESSNTEITKAIAEVSLLLKDTLSSTAVKQKETLEETCEQIKNALNDVNENLKKATDKMVEASATANAALINTVDTVKNRAEDTDNIYVQSAGKQAEAMDSASVVMRQNLSATVDKLQELLDGHDHAMTKAYNEFDTITQKASTIVNEASESAEKFAAAAVPVTQATNGLREQMVEVVKANTDFNKAVSSQNAVLAETARMNEIALNKYLQSLDSTQKQWQAYEKHFAGVSGELQRTFEVLESGIKNYQTTTDRGLKNTLADYDKSMTNTITVLSDRISELNEMTEALADSAKALRKSRSL